MLYTDFEAYHEALHEARHVIRNRASLFPVSYLFYPRRPNPPGSGRKYTIFWYNPVMSVWPMVWLRQPMPGCLRKVCSLSEFCSFPGSSPSWHHESWEGRATHLPLAVEKGGCQVSADHDLDCSLAPGHWGVARTVAVCKEMYWHPLLESVFHYLFLGWESLLFTVTLGNPRLLLTSGFVSASTYFLECIQPPLGSREPGGLLRLIDRPYTTSTPCGCRN